MLQRALQGDLRGRVSTADLRGSDLRIATLVNDLLAGNEALGAELERVARMVGREGVLTERARPHDVGPFAGLAGTLNSLVDDLVRPIGDVARVVGAVADGDLSQTIELAADGRPLRGDFLAMASSMNRLVRQLSDVSSEVMRVAREMGSEGKLGAEARARGFSGEWRNLTESVNMLAGNLTAQFRNIALVTTAVANGDLSRKITVDAHGEIEALKQTINMMVDQLRTFAAEVTRVAREVGTDGKLGGQADVKGVSGTWRDLTDNVNQMASNLTNQVRGIARVVTAVANGDLSQKLVVDAKGEIAALADTINNMTADLRLFADQVTTVAREVGIEGRLGGQARVPDVAGVWKDLTNNVNLLAGNLTSQVRNIGLVTTAVARGDLSQKISVDARGEVLELKSTINTMVDQLRSFAAEVTRVAREVGDEGNLGGQADVRGVSGTWKDLTDSVNMLAGNLTSQVRNIALVTTAVASGDLSQKITVDAKGEVLELKSTINTMVDQLRAFAAEVTRVAREVGTEGKLGGQAQVPGVAGTWKDLTVGVNLMASNLTSQVRGIVKVVNAVAEGDLSQKFVVEAKGEIAALADTINDMTDTLRIFAEQVISVAREVGIEGKLGGQARVPGVSGTWRDLTENVNMLAGNLTAQVRNIALVTTAVAYGDLSQTISVDARGEILELKDTINAMVERLRTFAREVTRVAREVGTDGKLGGQADVKGVSGTWQDLTESVNLMATNLTNQVRGIVKVVTAVAGGDLSQKLSVDAKGEIAALADTINGMTDTLRVFADQVTTVAREVGIEGKLGGQARVPGASGTWRDLVDNVNQLAGNLTTQVRAIADVAIAVTEGDLTRTIDVEAAGEVLSLKDTINQMIANLRDTTESNLQQDWLKTNLAKFTGMMQGQRTVENLAGLLMSELTPVVSAQVGTFFVHDDRDGGTGTLRLVSSYGYEHRKRLASRFRVGEGLVGQAALERRRILVTEVPEDYVRISSSLGDAAPRNLVVLPILFEGQVKGVIELGSFQQFSAVHLTLLEQLMLSVGVVFNMISAGRRTEELLAELQRSNSELGARSRELEDKASLLEVRNREIADTSASLEEKARQLALVSKYKSEFLANMSHELRTPLNSVLILAGLLADNESGNLDAKQVEYAETIRSSGRDLLALISQILDLSKIEAGRMSIERRRVPVAELRSYLERHFQPIASQRRLGFSIAIRPDVPPTINTDSQRLEQILKNLLSNAFKFTESGRVELNLICVPGGSGFRTPELRQARTALGFEVSDTGIGVAPDKQEMIFEAFQQADASTSRNYGGTGLGLTISRELARLLGGEIHLRSTAGVGSTFTLFLPVRDEDRQFPGPADDAGGFERSHEDSPAGEPPAVTGAPNGAGYEELDGKRVLVVDDDVRNLFAVTSLLERYGVRVVAARSAQQAVDALERAEGMDAVLMDIMMPEMDGYQATALIRSQERFARLPIVALTAKAMPGDRERCLEAGCSDFVPKPVDRDQLLRTLLRWVAPREAT